MLNDNSSIIPTRVDSVAYLSLVEGLSNRNDDGVKNVTKFACLTMKNSSFVRFARAFAVAVLVQLTSKMTCFAVMWSTCCTCGTVFDGIF